MITKLFNQYPNLKSILAIMCSIVILDQITKVVARIYLKPVHEVTIIGDFFRLTYVENPGIAFGLRIENKLFFTILSILAVLVIFYYLFLLKNHKTLRIAFALILGGAFGNLIDRFLYGRVVDFLDFEFFDISIPPFQLLFLDFNGYSMDRWPVFNVADTTVTVGMIIIILNAIFEHKQIQISSNENLQNN